ncbi:MAG: hypothetical protein ACM3VX_06500 [Bacteroidota bacterium]
MALSTPSRELAQRILTEVGFEHRMVGARVREHAGPMSQTMYSFAEIHGLLTDRDPRMDFVRLEEWIRTVMGDVELADRVAEAIKVGTCGADQAWRIRDLMGERLAQCREIIAAEESGGRTGETTEQA